MVKLGYKLMAEEHAPATLVANAIAAEKAGFDFAAISDHFFPWIEERGHSPFAWAVLGASFDHIIITQIGSDQALLLNAFDKEMAPALRALS